MYTHLIKTVNTIDSHTLLVIFQDGTEKTYDIRQLYDDYPCVKLFEEEPSLFEQVKLFGNSGYGIYWNDDLDLSANELWHSGVPTGIVHEISDMEALAVNLTYARASLNMSQVELAELTGIAQGDICKIERCQANPTFKTLKRLADAMNMRLKIEFVPKE